MARGERAEVERQRLRQLVHELKNEVVVLLSDKRLRNGRNWEEEARREFERRLRAEMERIELAANLQDQCELLKRIQRLLFRKCFKRVPHRLLLSSNHKHIQDVNPSSNELLLNDLWGCLRGMEEREVSVLADSRLTWTPSASSLLHVQLRRDQFLGESVEIAYARVYPFSLPDTMNAHWQMNRSRIRATHEVLCEKVTVTEDTVTSKFQCIVDVSGEPCLFHGALVSRRTRRSDHVVVTWSSKITADATHSHLSRSAMRMRGWEVLERATRSNSCQPMTVMRAFLVISAEPANEFVNATTHLAAAHELTRYVRNTAKLHVDAKFQTVENLLLENSLASANA